MKNLVLLLVFSVLWFVDHNVFADPQASTNYRIDWDVIDASGIPMTSTNYTVFDSPAQAGPIGMSASTNYQLSAGFHAPPDSDTDTVRDFVDNCSLDPNSSQLDTNNDGFGNFCDPDLNNDGSVNFVDYAQMTVAFLATPASPNWNADADLNGDNIVNFIDIARFQLFFLGPPGPSGVD
ncbi:MAG: dockerin type I domain-containing protein [Pseudomonadota bacterium]